MNRYSKVISSCDRTLRLDLTNEEKQEVIFHRASAHFLLQKFRELYKDIDLIKEMGNVSTKYEESFIWWSEAEQS